MPAVSSSSAMITGNERTISPPPLQPHTAGDNSCSPPQLRQLSLQDDHQPATRTRRASSRRKQPHNHLVPYGVRFMPPLTPGDFAARNPSHVPKQSSLDAKAVLVLAPTAVSPPSSPEREITRLKSAHSDTEEEGRHGFVRFMPIVTPHDFEFARSVEHEEDELMEEE